MGANKLFCNKKDCESKVPCLRRQPALLTSGDLFMPNNENYCANLVSYIQAMPPILEKTHINLSTSYEAQARREQDKAILKGTLEERIFTITDIKNALHKVELQQNKNLTGIYDALAYHLLNTQHGTVPDKHTVKVFRPRTRGALAEALKKKIRCEVVASNEEFTSFMLKGWLKCENFKTYPSINEGWIIYESTEE